MTKPVRRDTDEVLAVLALLGQTGVRHGARPTQLELAELSRGALSASRLAEIESHVAHDPRVFRDFLGACEAVTHVRTAPRQRWRAPSVWRASLAALAACVVAAISVVLVMNAQQPAAAPDLPRLAIYEALTRTPRATATDWRRRAVRYGYENPSALKRLIGPSGDALSGTCAAGACGNEIDALTEFGAALARLESACRASRSPDEALAAAPYEIHRLQAVRSQLSDAHWRRQVDRALVALARPTPQACAGVNRIGRLAGALQ